MVALLAAGGGCDDSIRQEFRQTAGDHVKSTVNTVLDNFFQGVDDVLDDTAWMDSSAGGDASGSGDGVTP